MKKELKSESLIDWLKINKPLIISGPCSAESETQMVSTAKQLKATGKVHVLRAGIWKPRTRPGHFEGAGDKGLEWLIAAKKETGLPVTTEVANAAHVEACLKAGVDILWIGARTSVNPFSVQDIADALKGVDVPVMVKNPVNPDLELWIGALERISHAGIKRLAAIHRGFSSYQKESFRNAPMWDIAIELKMQFPNLEIICDPSHISGKRELIPFVAQKALDLDMSGLMIESHIQPSVALSDKEQQLTPAALDKLLEQLIVRTVTSSNKQFKDKLTILREQIDELDDNIFHKLAARMDIARQIGNYKLDNNITVLQVSRWEEILQTRLLQGNAMGLSDEFIKNILRLIHNESIQIQESIMNKMKVTEDNINK